MSLYLLKSQMQNWINETSWPKELQTFVQLHGRDPLQISDVDPQISTELVMQLASLGNNGRQRQSLQAALFLVGNQLDASHHISQNLHSPIGSYLHGIMHRREGDYGNAKYWFHQAGSFGFFQTISMSISLAERQTLSGPSASDWAFDPAELTDLHRTMANSQRSQQQSALREVVTKLAWLELRAVIDDILETSTNASL